MRNNKIKKLVNNSISNSVPDCLDNILLKCDEGRGFSKNMKEEKNKQVFFIPKLVGGLCVLLLVGLFGVGVYNSQFAIESVIEFDVNPSIELKINKKEKVVNAIALNEDAKKVLKDMDLEKVDLDVAVNAIIGSMMKNGYLTIDQNSILVSVKSKDVKESERIQKEITKEINSLLKASSIDGSVLTQEFDDNDKAIEELSSNHNISVGKAKLINNVLNEKITNSKGELYTFDTLASLSITELNLLLNEKETKVEKVKTTGNVSESGYIGKEKAKSIALNAVNTKENKVSKLEIEFDVDDGVLVYEVEFNIGVKEYEYDIHAKTGEIVYENNEKTEEVISSSYIGKTKAKSIALNNAGVKESKVSELEVELDKKENKYEVEFEYNGKEYSYEINATSGKIIDKEVERD